MLSNNNKKAVLLLEDGTILLGTAFGKIGTTTGEVCFNTGMTGYQEVFTDPSYYGQVLIMNSVHTGNYGVTPIDVESDGVKVKGVIGRNLEEKFSRFMAEDSLQSYFEKQNIVAINGVDTRALVNHVRTKGAMNCIISSETDDIEILKQQLSKVPSMNGLELASIVSTKTYYTLGNENSDIRVAVLDFGIKKNILTCLVQRGAFVKVFINVGAGKTSIVVPTNCIIPNDKDNQLVLVKNGTASFVNVQTGIRQANTVEIVSGINVGDSVVVSGVLFAKPKSKLKVRSVKKLAQLAAADSTAY